MTNPFTSVTLPTVPEELGLWGLPGKQTARKITNDLGDISDGLEILARFAGRESALTEFIGDPANSEDPAVADYTSELETIGEEESDAEEARDKAIQEATEAFEKAKEGYDKRRNAAENALQESHPEIFADAPTAEENSDAVMAVDLAIANIRVNVKKTIDSLKSREVPNPRANEEGQKDTLTIEDVLGSFTVPNMPGKKTGTLSKGEGEWKPRFSKAVVNGKTLADPRSPSIAKELGMSREVFLRRLATVIDPDDFKQADTGKSFTVGITVENLDKPESDPDRMKTHSVLVVKGNAPTQ